MSAADKIVAASGRDAQDRRVVVFLALSSLDGKPLGTRVVGDVIEIGRRLTECKGKARARRNQI